LDKVRHIRLIPLNDSSLTYFGNDPDIFYDKQEFYVADKNGNGKVYRINDNGNLISIIGEKGRGPNEYLDIKNIQVEGDTVYIFSSPNITISKFLTDGSFISKNTIDINAQQAIVQDTKLITYALTRKYFESDYMRVLETLVSTKNGPMFTYGFNMKNDDHQWIWFSMGDVRKSAFVNSLKEISENRLYFLLDPSGLEYLPNDVYNKILNKDVLNNTEENSNYIIAEFLINL